jgi:outer membrane lipoprotein SlyB
MYYTFLCVITRGQEKWFSGSHQGTKMNSVKKILVLAAFAGFSMSAQALNCVFCDFPAIAVPADSTLSYGTVTSLEPVDMAQVDYTQLNDHQMATAGAAVSGGSLTGALVGAVVGVVADAVVHKSTKVIDGYQITIELDSGEKKVIARTKNQMKSSGFDAVGDRIFIFATPKETWIRGSRITREEAPSVIAKRAPHQVQKPVEVTPEAKSADQKVEVQAAIPNADEAKTASAN